MGNRIPQVAYEIHKCETDVVRWTGKQTVQDATMMSSGTIDMGRGVVGRGYR